MGTISLCMIGQDEAHCVIENLLPCVDYVDEIIFIDGGSLDNTVDLVSQVPKSHVFQIPFHRHFAKQKNEAVSRATCDWVLVKDCDEVFEQDILNWLQNLQTLGYDAIAFARKSRIDGWLCNVQHPDFQIRYWKNGIDIHFEGQFHESPTGYKNYLAANLFIHHNKTTEEQMKDNLRVFDMGQLPGEGWTVGEDGHWKYTGLDQRIGRILEEEQKNNPVYQKPYRLPDPRKKLLRDGCDFIFLREKYNQRMPIEQPPLLSTDYLNPSPMEAWIEEWIHGGRMLDVGCGNAKFLLHLALTKQIDEGWGIDISDEMIANAQKGAAHHGLTNLHFIRGAFEHLSIQERYDVISVVETLEHMYSPWSVIGMDYEMLNPGGVFIGTVPHEQSCDCDVHLHYFNSEKLSELLKEFFTDFEIKEHHFISGAGVPEGHIMWRARK